MMAWLLIVVYGHSAFTVPSIPTLQDCEATYAALAEKGWKGSGIGRDHDCIQYRIVK